MEAEHILSCCGGGGGGGGDGGGGLLLLSDWLLVCFIATLLSCFALLCSACLFVGRLAVDSAQEASVPLMKATPKGKARPTQSAPKAPSAKQARGGVPGVAHLSGALSRRGWRPS